MAILEGIVTAQKRERWVGSTTGPGVAETATTFMGSDVRGSHERRFKFCVSLLGVVSRKRAASSLVHASVDESTFRTSSVFDNRRVILVFSIVDEEGLFFTEVVAEGHSSSAVIPGPG